jgi:diguanylate cyclase (GGDEF)-like protein
VGTTDDRVKARGRKMRLGAVLNMACHGVAALYCLATWAGPHRSLMLAAYGCGMAVGVVGFWAAKMGAAKALGYRFSFAMLLISIIAVALGAHWDGGAASPTAHGFVLPALFVASSAARMRLLLALESVVVGAYLVVATTGQPASPAYVFAHVTSMVAVIAVCATQTRMVARQRSQLRSLAELDPLTGALNRRGLIQLTKRLFTGGDGASASVVCLDLDDFKLVNDRLGHAAGDELLRWTVTVARDVLRPADAIARTGGDEFVVVLADADEATARAVANKIGRAVRERTGVSIGWASAPQDGDTLTALVHAADLRLYSQKQERQRVGDR